MLQVCFDCYGSYTTDSVYQWDLNRRLAIRGLDYDSAPAIHFSNKKSTEALVVQSTIEDGVIYCDVPNILLQEHYDIVGYVCSSLDQELTTYETIRIPVKQRVKPADYAYSDNVEILTYYALMSEITSVKASTEKDLNIMDASKASKAELNAVKAEVENNLDTNIAKVEDEIASERARIDQLVASPEMGEGDFEKEVEDLRIDTKGTTHGSAGTAVRKQFQDLDSKIDDNVNSLSSEIVEQSIFNKSNVCLNPLLQSDKFRTEVHPIPILYQEEYGNSAELVNSGSVVSFDIFNDVVGDYYLTLYAFGNTDNLTIKATPLGGGQSAKSVINGKANVWNKLEIPLSFVSGDFALRISLSTVGSVKIKWLCISTKPNDDFFAIPNLVEKVNSIGIKGTFLNCGDSIAYGAGNNGRGYIYEITENVVNVAVSGATISVVEGKSNILSQIQSNNADFDRIISDGGYNDYANGVELGEVPTQIVEGNINGTFAEALCATFYYWLVNFPLKEKYFVIPHKINRTATQAINGNTFADFVEVIVKICKLYGIETVNCFEECSLNTILAEHKLYTSNSDGVHPNGNGYTLYKQVLLSKIH